MNIKWIRRMPSTEYDLISIICVLNSCSKYLLKFSSKVILRSYYDSDTKTRQWHYQKRKLQANIFVNIDVKILNKILAHLIQQHMQKIIHCGQVGFIPESQGWSNIYKSVWYQPHQQKERQKPYDHLNRCRKSMW